MERGAARIVGMIVAVMALGFGIAALDALSRGLHTLIADRALRNTLGKSGREWVRATHSRERFLEAFFRLCDLAGVAR